MRRSGQPRDDSDRMRRETLHVTAMRRYFQNSLNRVTEPLQQRISVAKLQFSQRPLLKANYPVFNDICRQFNQEIHSTWRQLNNMMRSQPLSTIVPLFDQSIVNYERLLTSLVDQLFQILSIPDSEILERLKIEIRQKYEDDFAIIQQRCDRIPVDSAKVAGEKEYFEYLMKTHLNEINGRLANAHDHSTITALRMLINRHKRSLIDKVGKIEKIAAGEDSDDSLVLSDLSDEDST